MYFLAYGKYNVMVPCNGWFIDLFVYKGTKLVVKMKHTKKRKEKNIALNFLEKVNFRSQILERPSICEYWNISGVPVLP